MILRAGGVTREALEDVLRRSVKAGSQSQVRVRGQHALHHAPRARVVLVAPNDLVREAERLADQGQNVGVLLPRRIARAPSDVSAALVVPDSMPEYARHLYDMLRDLDRRGCSVIVASLPAEHRLGLAIADWLRRAAGPRGDDDQREAALRSSGDGHSLKS